MPEKFYSPVVGWMPLCTRRKKSGRLEIPSLQLAIHNRTPSNVSFLEILALLSFSRIQTCVHEFRIRNVIKPWSSKCASFRVDGCRVVDFRGRRIEKERRNELCLSWLNYKVSSVGFLVGLLFWCRRELTVWQLFTALL